MTQEDSFSQNESGGIRRSGSRSRFLKKNKSKEAILGSYKDPENISNFDSQVRESKEYDSVRSSFVSKKALSKNRVIDDELIMIEAS